MKFQAICSSFTLQLNLNLNLDLKIQSYFSFLNHFQILFVIHFMFLNQELYCKIESLCLKALGQHTVWFGSQNTKCSKVFGHESLIILRWSWILLLWATCWSILKLCFYWHLHSLMLYHIQYLQSWDDLNVKQTEFQECFLIDIGILDMGIDW